MTINTHRVLAVAIVICLSGGCSGNAAGGQASDGGGVLVIPTPTPTPTPTSTSNSKGKTIVEAINIAESQPSAVKLDYSTNLLGEDKDRNGIRDDIDAYVSSMNLSQTDKMLIFAEARALNAVISINLSDGAQISSAANEIVRTTGCALKSSASGSLITISKLLESYTFNTPERYAIYDRFNEAVGGRAYDLPEPSTCK